MQIVPKNWAEFQHYKNRRPPWIKLYRTLLDDVEFHCLPDASKALAIMLWLLASEHESGSINADHKALAYRLRTTPQKIASALKPLIEAGFFVASTMLAGCLQDAIPETETETETETDKRQSALQSLLDLGVVEQEAKDWLSVRKAKHLPFTDTVLKSLISESGKAGIPVAEAVKICAVRGWGAFDASWNWKGNGGGNGKSKFNPVQYVNEQFAKELDAGASQETVDDLHGKVHPLLPR